MAVFVLVHGSMHGSWCWDDVRQHLEAMGHLVLAPDLPGRPGNPALRETCTLTTNAAYVASIIEQCDAPVILVGHSAGGVVISAVAELMPERIARLAYVAALLLPEGEAFAQYVAPMPISMTPDQTGILVSDAAAAIEWMYNRSDPQTAAQAASRLVPETILGFHPPLRTTAERFGTVPRAYVACTSDRAVPIEGQRHMCAVLPCDPYIELDTDHSPWLSSAEELAFILGRLA